MLRELVLFVLLIEGIEGVRAESGNTVHARFVEAIQLEAESKRKWKIGRADFPVDPEDWKDAGPAIRSQLQELLSFPLSRVALRPEISGTISRKTFRIEKLVFTAEEGNKIPALLYVPRGEGPFPAMAVASGHGGSKSTPYNQYLGQMLAATGCVVIVPDPIGEEERDEQLRFGPRGHRKLNRVDRCLELGVTTLGKMVYDITRCVDYLETRPEIDPTRIACSGHSLGGTVSQFAAAVDPRIKVCLVAGWTPNHAAITPNVSCCWRVPKLLNFVGDAELFAMGAPHCSTLVLGGEHDLNPIPVEQFRGTTFEAARTIYHLAGRESHFAFHVTPDTGHEPFHLNRQSLAWLERHFDLPRITAEEIENLGPAILTRLPQPFEDKQWQLERILAAKAPEADVILYPFDELRCLAPGEERNPEFSMMGWIAAKDRVFSAKGAPDVETIMRRLNLPEIVPALSSDSAGASESAAEKIILYLHQSRTASGGMKSSRFDHAALTREKVRLISLDAAPFNETLHLLGSSSTAYSVKHLLYVVAGLPPGIEISLVSEVDDVGQFAALLEPRISELTIAGNPHQSPPRQSYRWSGVVPGMKRLVDREGLVALLAPLPVHIENTAGLTPAPLIEAWKERGSPESLTFEKP